MIDGHREHVADPGCLAELAQCGAALVHLVPVAHAGLIPAASARFACARASAGLVANA